MCRQGRNRVQTLCPPPRDSQWPLGGWLLISSGHLARVGTSPITASNQQGQGRLRDPKPPGQRGTARATFLRLLGEKEFWGQPGAPLPLPPSSSSALAGAGQEPVIRTVWTELASPPAWLWGVLYMKGGGWQVLECGHSPSLPSRDLCVKRQDGTETSDSPGWGWGVSQALVPSSNWSQSPGPGALRVLMVLGRQPVLEGLRASSPKPYCL